MGYDFGKVAKEAARVAENAANNESKEFKYKLVYPGQGKLKFRILFNPKSGLIGRLITRHAVGNDGKKVLCASTYTNRKDCPICKVLEEIKNMGVAYPREYDAKTRGVFFAQYVSSDYEVASGSLKKGDVFILMVPYTMYQAIMKWVNDFASDASIMARVFGSHESYVQVIEKGAGGTDWTFRPDPNIFLESAKTDDEFATLLENLDSLYEVCGFHKEITSDEVALMHTTADSLRDSFIGSASPTQTGYTPPEKVVESAQAAQADPTPASAAPQAAPTTPAPTSAPEPPKTGVPSCYGTYTSPEQGAEDPARKGQATRCKYCPVNQKCKADTH